MKKGFTLIELLAVIVILAVIALIATPTILSVVDDARKGAAKASVLGYIDAVEKQAMINAMDEEKEQLTDALITDLTKVNIKGQRPDSAYTKNATNNCYTAGLQLSNGEVPDSLFVYGNNKYSVTYEKATGEATVANYSAPTLCD